MNLFDILERGARNHGAKDAIRFEQAEKTRTITYQQLHLSALGCSVVLREAGVKKGDRVAVFLPNIPEYPSVTYGAFAIGAVPVLFSSSLKTDKAREYVDNCQAKVLVTSEELAAEASLACQCPSVQKVVLVEKADWGSLPLRGEVPQQLDLSSNDPALILYTSGTTGKQKGAVLSHGNVASNIQVTNRHTRMTSDDIVMCFLPLFHCFGQNFVMNAALNAGATLVLHKRFELGEILESLRKNRVTMFLSIPPNYGHLLELNDISAFETVRYFFTAADTMPPEIVLRWREKYRRQIWEGWGLAETSPLATYNHDTCYKPGTVGTAIQDVEIRISDDAGEWLAPGEIGEINICGPNVFQGYYRDPEATARVLRDGWFRTGDIGRLDEEGYLYIVDRKNDRIKVSGFSVWPREIEKFLREYFAGRIEDVGVIGIPDKDRGEMPLAFVVARDPQLHEAEIIGACRQKLAGYQQLKRVEFTASIPKTPTGKILKGQLRMRQDRI